MALINCPECNNQVSSTAESCPHCGAPIAGALEGAAAGVQIKTVQETSKKLKFQILISSALFWIGLIWLFAISDKIKDPDSDEPLTPAILISVGMIWYIVTRVRVWWHHK